MKPSSLIIPNLAKLGVPRLAPAGEADLETIWLTPYPVITNYLALCNYLKIEPFGGGSRQYQGEKRTGYITSGFRTELIGSNFNSPHRFGIAIDFIVLENIVEVASGASLYYNRVGVYPDNKFIHVDLAQNNWIKKYNKRRFWVNSSSEYSYFDTIEKTIAKLRETA